jgi:hypothetical protein
MDLLDWKFSKSVISEGLLKAEMGVLTKLTGLDRSLLILVSKRQILSIFFLNLDFLMIYSRVSSFEFLFLLFEIISFIIYSFLG